MAQPRRASRGDDRLLLDRVARISLPQTFFETIFSGFTILRHDREDRCLRYWLGSEEDGAFLPFYDHRPAVIRAAGDFEREPGQQAALDLFRELARNADVQVRSRKVKDREHGFVNLWPAAGRAPEALLTGTEQDLDPDAMTRGLSLSGPETLWYWFGLLPRAAEGSGRKGLKVVQVRLVARS